MNIVVQPNIARRETLERLSAIDGAEVVVVESADELANAVVDADVLVIGGHSYTERVDRLLRTDARGVRFVQLLTAGYEGVQTIGTRPGLVVANAGESWSIGVAEHAMALMLALVKCLPRAFMAQELRAWDRSYSQRMGTLRDRTLAIVGYGSIGREVALRAKGFGMKMIGVSRSGRGDDLVPDVRPSSALDEVLALADVILLSMPSTPETRGLISHRRLAACRPDALLINIARGDLVDAAALDDALRKGRLGGAGIDATDPEPLPPTSPLWDAPNTIVTAHMSGACGQAGRERLADFVAANVNRFVHGQQPTHVLNVQRP